MYFNYHAKLKKLIREGHCTTFKFVESYHDISPCLLLEFDDGKVFPVREHRFSEYSQMLSEFNVEQYLEHN